MSASRTLILMRHAEAGGAYNDHERPLTPAGLIDATAAGSWIRSALPGVDAVLCSTALRTRQTLSATGVGAPTRFAQELYGGGIDDILSQIALTPDTASTVLVVGHAPGIPATAHELLTVAALVRADGGSGDDDGPTTGDPGENREHPAVDGLRHFSAGAVAVLTTAAPWAALDEQGADLQTVRYPHR
jgi:phosphohistidine phosphatase